MTIGWHESVRNGLAVVELETAASTCTVALQGAQVLSFRPRGQTDWLWLSERARWTAGAAVRGGIPICFPWFGPHPTARAFPAHGFARTRAWRLVGVAEAPGGRARAELALADSAETTRLYPHPFEARLTVTAGPELELSFEVANTAGAPLPFEIALHTYFAVSDIGAVAIEGLGGADFIDKVGGGQQRRQGEEPLRIDGEVDRVYAAAGPLTLGGAGRARPLHIQPRDAASTVVWNPGPQKAAALADMAPDGYRGFVCVETGIVGAHAVTLPPGARRAMSVRYEESR
jgi:glucose-6-phosphate 1-epimerase